MGRIKTQQVKRLATEIFEKYSDKFTTDFEENKKIIGEVADIESKKMRNLIVGFITRLKKNEEVI